MAKDASMRAFKCPSCGAPLEPAAGTLTMKCPYCGGTVIIPESLRTPGTPSGWSTAGAFQFGLNGLDLNKIVGNAMKLPEAISLAQEGKTDEAADMYSEITGMGHAEAVAAIKAMVAGHAVALTPGRAGVTWQEGESFDTGPGVQISSPSVDASAVRRGCGGAILTTVIVAALVIGALAVGGFLLLGNSNPLASLGFAHKTLSFGGKGIGTGLLEDSRSLGVAGGGDIVVADYQDGRVQTFDPGGRFLATFSIGQKTYVSGLAVGRDGKIYIAHDQKIFIYDPNGTELGQIGDDQHDYGDVTLGPDGRLYAIANDETIVRFKPDGSIDLEIPDTFSNATGDSELDSHLAVDGLGNMYIVGSFNYAVLKYSPDGKFLNRFGSKGDGNGKFTSPLSIAVDGYGRIYVGDFWGILVFDLGGTYLNTIDLDKGVAFGVTFDGQNNLYVATSENEIQKFQIQKPKGN